MNLLREVAEKVNRPFDVKLAETREVITHHFDEFGDKVAVAFSGGKDSEIVLYFCLKANPNVPVVFNNTGVEYPETVNFVARLAGEWDLNLTVTHPEKSFWDCIKQYGFPSFSKSANKGAGKRCCYWLKEKPMLASIRQNGWLGVFTGQTASEGWQRQISASKTGICFHYKAWGICKIHAILWWTESEVQKFIEQNNLPLNPVYLKEQRTGCMPCTAYKKWEEQMQRVNPKLYRIIKLRKDNQYVMELI
jgi:phosphoadenosine phosphosulfate reductase